MRYDYDYDDLTAIYGRDGKKLRGFAYHNHIMVEHSQPDGLVSRYEYDRYDTEGKVLKSSNYLGEERTSTTAKTILSLPTLTIRQLRPLGASPRLDNRRR